MSNLERFAFLIRDDVLNHSLKFIPFDSFLLNKAVGDLKLRTALMTIYSAGLRISEAMRLTAQDIDSARMVICVRQGKGRKDRYTVLSQQLLGILRDYWRATRPSHWLFPGRNPARPMTKRMPFVRGGRDVFTSVLPKRCVLVMGAEQAGVDAELFCITDQIS